MDKVNSNPSSEDIIYLQEMIFEMQTEKTSTQNPGSQLFSVKRKKGSISKKNRMFRIEDKSQVHLTKHKL